MLNGSIHEDGNTMVALEEIGKQLEKEGIEYEIFQIGTNPIRDCQACAKCKRDGCHFTDDVCNAFIEKAKEADGYIFTSPVYYADINWTAVMKQVRKNSVSFKEISKYPAVSRDLALLLDKQVEFAQIEAIAYKTERKYLKSVELFDVYEGKNLPEGKKSYAVNFILQDEQKTLTDKQIEAIMNKLIANIKKELNAELR